MACCARYPDSWGQGLAGELQGPPSRSEQMAAHTASIFRRMGLTAASDGDQGACTKPLRR